MQLAWAPAARAWHWGSRVASGMEENHPGELHWDKVGLGRASESTVLGQGRAVVR